MRSATIRAIPVGRMKAVMPKIAAEFAAIPVQRVPKVKVGVVGEIYVKYSPLGNNDLEKFLASQDCEVNLPGLMGFVQYCAYNLAETVRLYGGSHAGEEPPRMRRSGYHRGHGEGASSRPSRTRATMPRMPFSELIKLPEQSHTIGMG